MPTAAARLPCTSPDGYEIRAKLAEEYPDMPGYTRSAAESQNNVGVMYQQNKNNSDAEKAFRRSVALQSKVVEGDPSDLKERLQLAQYLSNLGAILNRSGHRPEAEKELRRALDVHTKLAAQLPKNLSLQLALAGNEVNLGILLIESDKASDALPILKGASDRMKGVQKQLPNHPMVREFYANSQGAYAAGLAKLKRFTEAIVEWRRTIEIADKAKKDYFRTHLAHSLVHAGQHAEALELTETLLRTSDKPEQPYYAACIYSVRSRAAGVQPAQVETLQLKAMTLLKLAQERGQFKDPEKIDEAAKEDDLDPLKGRKDFRDWWKVLTGKEVEAPVPPGKKD